MLTINKSNGEEDMFYFCGFVDGVDGLQPLLLDVLLLCTSKVYTTSNSKAISILYMMVLIFYVAVVLLLLFIPFQLLPFLFGYFRFYTIDKFLAKFQDVILIQTVLVVLFCFIIIITSHSIASYKTALAPSFAHPRFHSICWDITKIYEIQPMLVVSTILPTCSSIWDTEYHTICFVYGLYGMVLHNITTKHITSKYRSPWRI